MAPEQKLYAAKKSFGGRARVAPGHGIHRNLFLQSLCRHRKPLNPE